MPDFGVCALCCRLGGGLAWLGILAVGSIGEQVKTRLEVAAEKANTQDVTDVKEVRQAFADLDVLSGLLEVEWACLTHWRPGWIVSYMVGAL